MASKKAHFITTGGTIDKIYGQGKGVTNFTFDKPWLYDIFRRAHVPNDVATVTELEPKDSQFLTQEDREEIARICRTVTSTHIVITHGTDTMIVSAQHVARDREAIAGKTIVFTGSSDPAAYRETDADGNVLFALGTALYAPPGVYIAMHGKLHDWHNCEKQEDGTFTKPSLVITPP